MDTQSVVGYLCWGYPKRFAGYLGCGYPKYFSKIVNLSALITNYNATLYNLGQSANSMLFRRTLQRSTNANSCSILVTKVNLRSEV